MLRVSVAIVVGIYFLLLILWGLYNFIRKSREGGGELEAHYVGERSLGTGALTATLVASWASSYTLLAAAESGFQSGISGPIWYAAALAIPFLFFVWPVNIVERIREAAPKGVTMIEYIEHRYDEKTRIMSLIVVLVASVVYIISVVLALGIFLSSLLNIGTLPATIIGGVVLVLYTALSGFEGTVRSHVFQLIIAGIAVFISLYYTIKIDSGQFFSSLSEKSLDALAWGSLSMLDFLIVLIAMTFATPVVWQRIFAAKDSKSARRAFIWTMPALVPFAAGAGIMGMGAFVLMPQIDPSQAATEFVMGAFPTWAAVAFLLGAMALIFSSGDAYINNISSIVQLDIVERYRKTPLTKKQNLYLSFGLQLSLGIIGIVGALGFTSILGLLVLNSSIYISLVMPLYFGLTWRRATSAGAFWSMLLSFVVGGLLIINQFGTLGNLVSVLISVVVIIIVSFMTANKEHEQLVVGTNSNKPIVGMLAAVLIYVVLYVIVSLNKAVTFILPLGFMYVLVFIAMAGCLLIAVIFPVSVFRKEK